MKNVHNQTMYITCAVLFALLASCAINTGSECRTYSLGHPALLFLERIGDEHDCPTDIVLYAKTSGTNGYLNADNPEPETHTHYAEECKTIGVAHLDGYDLRTMEKLENVKIAYTIYSHDPPHGMAFATVSELCERGEYGVYVGVRP